MTTLHVQKPESDTYDEEADECAREIEWKGGKHRMTLNHPTVLASIEGDRPLRFGFSVTGGIQRGSPGELVRRLVRFQNSEYSLFDIEDTIWHGLVYELGRKGADEMIENHVRGNPIEPNAILAFNLLVALFRGENVGAVNDGDLT